MSFADGHLDGVSVYDVLRKGLQDLQDLCDVVTDKFTEARDEYDASHDDKSKVRA